MARINGNDVTLGLRGKFGKQFVFRKFKNRTIAFRRPDEVESKNTESQVAHRERFRIAALYAKRALLSPELKEEYEAIARATDGASAFAIALGDFMKPVSSLIHYAKTRHYTSHLEPIVI